jgi:hypothetical protein
VAYRKERFRLRFFGLPVEIEDAIRSALPGVGFKCRFSQPRASNVLLFDLKEAMDLSALYATLDSLQLEPKQLEVLASVVTESDNGGIDLPRYILQLIRRTHCSVAFMFVNVGPDEIDEDDRETGHVALQ